MFGGHAYNSDFTSLDRYFFHFAMAARAGRCGAGEGLHAVS
jgi:hypothetical protein